MTEQRDVQLRDGRVLRVHDVGAAMDHAGFALLWHHGSPQTGALLDPIVEAAAARGIRLVSYARPSYGGSTPDPGRSVASAGADALAVMNALDIRRFAVMGASGGGPPTLACAAMHPERAFAAVTLAGIAPWTQDFDWFVGMVAPGALRAAQEGREARMRFAASDEFDRHQFIEADWAALDGPWRSLGRDAMTAETAGPEGLVDDDVSAVTKWGFDVGRIAVPVLVVQGGEDRVIPRAHGEWLVAHIPTAELWLRPRDGHVSILSAVPVAMDWLRDRWKAR